MIVLIGKGMTIFIFADPNNPDTFKYFIKNAIKRNESRCLQYVEK
jgi:hypothetical protein